jgi:hypothetical protein
MVSWWKAENNTVDSLGTNNGVLTNVSFASGEVGQSFSFNSAGSAVRIPSSSSLDVGSKGGLTIEGWVNPADVIAGHPIFEWNSGSFGTCLWISRWDGGLPAGTLYANLKDIGFNEHPIQSVGGIVQSNVFQHVALTYDQASATAALYLNGVVVIQQTVVVGLPLFTATDGYIGYRPADGGAGSRFVGQIDELSLYSRALSPAEIQAICYAGVNGKCVNHSPTAANLAAATRKNQPISIPIEKLLALASDPDGDSLTVDSVTGTSTNGAAVSMASGAVTYTPVPNFIGNDRFGYTVNDGHNGAASASVLVQVRDTNQISGNMLPLVTIPGGYQVSFLGIPNLTYTLQRATSVSGPWVTLGPVTANSIGLATFADTNAPPGNAFYRTTYP